MARDLIPPPSPAGKPTSPDGTPNLIELPPEPPRSGAEPAQVADLPPSRYRNRFGFLIGALAGVVVAVAAAVGIALLSGDTAAQEGFAAHWSGWQPPQTDTTQGTQEIASHVGAEYKQPNGSQLTLVNGGPMPSTIPIALQPTSGPLVAISPSHGVVYTITGLGKGGAMAGKPSAQRLQLVRREALELALYTFRYIDGVESVMALLPTIPKGAPTKGGPTTDPQMQAVFYRPGDLKQQLQVPLKATMSGRTPRAGTIAVQDGRTVDALTLSNLFKWSIVQVQTGQSVLLLDRSGAG
jgi:hypothetical protein